MNILMIMTDQMHKYALGKISNFVKTPNLDKLAQDGTIFTNAYSNNPICGPFRGILFSGKYSKDNGVQNNQTAISPDELCLADELHSLNYDTSFVGKLHLGANGNVPIPKKFRAGHNHFIGYQCYNGFVKDVCFFDENEVKHTYDEHRTDVTAKLGMERLRELAKSDKPFLQTIFFQAPHYPEQPSKDFENIYNDVDIPLPEEYSEIDPYTPTYSPSSPKPIELCPDFQNYGNNIDKYLKLYYSMVTQIDYNVGLIIEELKNLGIYDNTAIIFSSDHGDMQGSHGEKNKCSPYERSCGIPLIINIPKLNQIPICEKPVSSVDYYPTCMELAGGVSQKNIPGKSLIDLLKGGTNEHPKVFAENHNQKNAWFMLRSDNYKLVVDDVNYKPSMFFDMKNDEIEKYNLINDANYSKIINDMNEELVKIIKS